MGMKADKTIRVICTKKGKVWATSRVVEVLYHKLPYCYFRTARKTYLLTGTINLELCRPKEYREALGVTFIDGFPRFWSTVRDILVSNKAKAEACTQDITSKKS